MSIFETAIGWVAPPLCLVCGGEGSVLCAACASDKVVPYGETCWNCGVKSPGGRTCQRCRASGTPSYVWVTTIYDGVASELLKVYKFGHQRAAATGISILMAGTLRSIYQAEAIKTAGYVVVPVPSATSRVRQRSFDHSELLGKKVASNLQLKFLPALGRLGQSRQVGAKRSDRIEQAEGRYYVRLPSLVKDRRVLLVDDVVTTGATLRAATKVLRSAGAKRVDALIFAKRL